MASSSSSSKPKYVIHRLAGEDFLPTPKRPRLRSLTWEDDFPIQKKARPPQSSSYEIQRRKAVEILNIPDHAALQQVITNLESSRVNKRLYTFFKSNYPNVLSLKLSHLFLNSPNDPDLRTDCSILLNYLLDSPNFWNSTSRIVRSELKIVFLEILKQDNRKEVCKVMWKLASQMFTFIIMNKEGEWPEMLSFFRESLNSATLYVQDYAVMFFLELPTCLCKELSEDAGDLRSTFWSIFDSYNGERKLYALAALINLVLHMSSGYYSHFRPLLMPMVEAVSGFLENDTTEDNAQTLLVKLAQLAAAEPRFFDSHLNQVFDEMIKIGVNDKLEPQTRYNTLEMMYAFDDVALKRVNKKTLGRLCHVLIEIISLVLDESCNYLLGEVFLQRISLVMGEKLQIPLLLKILPEDMASPDWRKRYAVTTIIGVLSKGCAEAMKDSLAEVMKVVMKSMTDPSSYVRYAAIRTVKAMSLDLPLHTLDQHANIIITWLLMALEDRNKPVKLVAAVSAMHYVCERCSSRRVGLRMETVVRKLLELLQNKHAGVQAESLNTLTSFAKSSKDLFCRGYDIIITSLKKHLASATTKSLRDNYVECILTVGVAVGKDLFSKDAAEIVALLFTVRWSLGEDDHTFKANLLQSWEQLVICLGSHFCPYMKDLMPDLLRSATLCSRRATEDVILKEKLKACKLLLCLTKELKGEFFPWIDQVSDIVLSLVKFHDGDIRKVAFPVMPKLLLSAKLAIEEKQAHGFTNSFLHKLVLRFVPSLLEALDGETNGEVYAKILKSLTKCIEIAGGFLSTKKIQQTANAVLEVLKAISRNHFSQEGDVTDLEKKIIGKIVYYIRILMEIYGESSMTLVDKFLEHLRAMISNDATAKDKEIALLTFNEIYLKCAETAMRF